MTQLFPGNQRQFNIDLIGAACIKANPELEGKHVFEVGGGYCKFCGIARVVRDRKVSNRIIDEKTGGSSQEVEVTDYNMEGGPCPEHTSRPIRLADVLLAIRYDHLAPLTEDRRERVKDLTVAEIVSRWNLRQDDLTLQSDECITFLVDLLK